MPATNNEIAITGATGFVGRELTRLLSSSGLKVRAFAGPNSGSLSGTEQRVPDVIDITRRETLSNKFSGCHMVCHTAGIAQVNNMNPAVYPAVNTEGTRNVYLEAQKSGVEAFVFLSSSLADTTANKTLTEYGKSKREAENLLVDLNAADDMRLFILRPVNVYGPGMRGNLTKLMRLIHDKRIPGLPVIENRISMISMEDLARAVQLCLASQSPGREPYLLSDGRQYSTRSIESAIYHALGREVPMLRCPHVVLYAAAGLAGFLGSMGLYKSGVSLRTYHNLVGDSLVSHESISRDLGYEPKGNFLRDLPAILEYELALSK